MLLGIATAIFLACCVVYRVVAKQFNDSFTVVYTTLRFEGSQVIPPFQVTMACAVPDTLVVGEEHDVTCEKAPEMSRDASRTLSWGPPQHLRAEVHGDEEHFRMLTSYTDLSNQSLQGQPRVSFRLFPTRTGDAQWLLSFVPIADLSSGEIQYGHALDTVVPVRVRESWLTVALWLLLVICAVAATLLVGNALHRRAAVISDLKARIDKAESNAEKQPEKAKFAWDLARVKLEAYFDRNLSQVNQVFALAVLMIAVGFGFVLWGVTLSLGQPKITPTSIVAAVAGIVAQFIGATVMVIYRSTMAQANQFMGVLERINTVGMAIQVLDSIPDLQGPLKNDTRAHIIGLLLGQHDANRGGTVVKSPTE
jgi:hypothetical protein